jgi:hypothetical protein
MDAEAAAAARLRRVREPAPAEQPAPAEAGDQSIRWVCDCSNPPVLLAIYDPSGRIEIKVRDRHYIAHNQLQATCPRCGTRHMLDIRRPPAPPAPPTPAS